MCLDSPLPDITKKPNPPSHLPPPQRPFSAQSCARSNSFSPATSRNSGSSSLAATVVLPKRTSTPELKRGASYNNGSHAVQHRSKSALGHGGGGENGAGVSVTTLVGGNQLSPIREQLHKFRRSVTEPLLQYFHDLHMVRTFFLAICFVFCHLFKIK